jgi:hypothetical protein
MSLRKSWFSDKVTSSDGWYVRPVNRAMILYADQTSKVFVSAEWLLGAKGMAWALYPDSMWVGSPEGEKLQDETRRSSIVKRIGDAFTYRGWRLEIG